MTGSFRVLGHGDATGASYLMKRVGTPFNVDSHEPAFAALQSLHETGCLHGDARLENLVVVDRKPVWIDFAGGCFDNEWPHDDDVRIRQRNDAADLARSLLKLPSGVALPHAVTTVIEQYVATAASAAAVAKATIAHVVKVVTS